MALIVFVSGTIEIRELKGELGCLPPICAWDTRTSCYRAPAIAYADVVRALVQTGIAFEDHAKKYEKIVEPGRIRYEPRLYQREALAAWQQAGGRGTVVLPTGAGKSHLALMAIQARKRSTLVVAPTLDLVHQWFELLRAAFGEPIGIIGGGDYTLAPITVTTYDSAYMRMEQIGDRFGLVIFDECHHLPGLSYALAARFSLAPFRLGLTATPERSDGRDASLTELIGPIVFRKDISELSGDYLAEYQTERIAVDLSPSEREEYEIERGIYLSFLKKNRIRMDRSNGWSEFVFRTSQSGEGRRAMKAYRRQRELAFAAPAKLDYVEHLMQVHGDGRILLFTQDNATAYRVSKRFLIPAITHQTKVRERSGILAAFSDGRYGAIVTSKVLNEGVDVPEANVAIVISGSGSVREHVQRLGRILRKKEGKQALLYELVSGGTAEAYTSDRRREHDAYR